MQLVRATSSAALLLLFGAIDPAYGQEKQDKPEKQQERERRNAPPAQQRSQAPQQQRQAQEQPQQRVQENRQQQRQSAEQPRQRQQQPPQQRAQENRQQRQQQEQAQRSQQARQQQQQQRSQQQVAVWQQQRGWQQQGAWRGVSTWQQGRAQRWESEHRTWAQRGGYGGYYIPQNSFSLYFGSQHGFRMFNRPAMYRGYPYFEYGGYSFMLLDPWPEYWDEDWYQTDDVYIDYDDGYYLYNRRYPSVRLSITVAL